MLISWQVDEFIDQFDLSVDELFEHEFGEPKNGQADHQKKKSGRRPAFADEISGKGRGDTDC